jgi:hypothetical protein
MKLEFSRQIFENYSKIKFHEDPSSWGRVLSVWTDGQTENRSDKANSSFSRFYERA